MWALNDQEAKPSSLWNASTVKSKWHYFLQNTKKQCFPQAECLILLIIHKYVTPPSNLERGYHHFSTIDEATRNRRVKHMPSTSDPSLLCISLTQISPLGPDCSTNWIPPSLPWTAVLKIFFPRTWTIVNTADKAQWGCVGNPCSLRCWSLAT